MPRSVCAMTLALGLLGMPGAAFGATTVTIDSATKSAVCAPSPSWAAFTGISFGWVVNGTPAGTASTQALSAAGTYTCNVSGTDPASGSVATDTGATTVAGTYAAEAWKKFELSIRRFTSAALAINRGCKRAATGKPITLCTKPYRKAAAVMSAIADRSHSDAPLVSGACLDAEIIVEDAWRSGSNLFAAFADHADAGKRVSARKDLRGIRAIKLDAKLKPFVKACKPA